MWCAGVHAHFTEPRGLTICRTAGNYGALRAELFKSRLPFQAADRDNATAIHSGLLLGSINTILGVQASLYSFTETRLTQCGCPHYRLRGSSSARHKGLEAHKARRHRNLTLANSGGFEGAAPPVPGPSPRSAILEGLTDNNLGAERPRSGPTGNQGAGRADGGGREGGEAGWGIRKT